MSKYVTRIKIDLYFHLYDQKVSYVYLISLLLRFKRPKNNLLNLSIDSRHLVTHIYVYNVQPRQNTRNTAAFIHLYCVNTNVVQSVIEIEFPLEFCLLRYQLVVENTWLVRIWQTIMSVTCSLETGIQSLWNFGKYTKRISFVSIQSVNNSTIR